MICNAVCHSLYLAGVGKRLPLSLTLRRDTRRSFLSLVCQGLLLSVMCLLLVSGLPAEETAYAASPLGESRVSVSVGFHERYSCGSKNYVHSGIDLPGASGDEVSAPCSGTVSFVGNVPAGDTVAGKKQMKTKTMLAVSIKLEDGKTLTLMPLSECDVKKGEAVGESERLGTLAAQGDRSLSKPHLHMGLKQGNTYYDPSYLLGAAFSSTTADAQEGIAVNEASSAAGNPPVASCESKADASVKSRLISPSVSAAPQGSLEREDAAGETAVEDNFGSISSAEKSGYVPQRANASGLIDQLKTSAFSCFASLMNACRGQAARLGSCAQTFSEETGLPLTMLLVAAAAALVGLLALCMRAVVQAAKFFGMPKKRENRLLSGLVGGDNIYKLFPAPGTTFMTRGR